MKFSSFMKKLLYKLGLMAKRNIQEQIHADLFSKQPFGEPLAEGTLSARRRRGNTDMTALEDTGAFVNGMKVKKNPFGVEIFSSGKSKRLQNYFVRGTATIPERNPFVKNLPLAQSSRTIEEAVIIKAGVQIAKFFDKEISKIKGVT